MEAPLDFSHPVRFGQCSVCFEPPDTIVVVTAGRMDAETIDHVMKALVALAHGKPYVLHLMDISRLEGLSTESRTATEQSNVIEASRGMAIFGGSITMRIIVSSVLRLYRILHRRFSLDPVRSFDTEAQARDWLVKRRGELQRELSLPVPPDRQDHDFH